MTEQKHLAYRLEIASELKSSTPETIGVFAALCDAQEIGEAYVKASYLAAVTREDIGVVCQKKCAWCDWGEGLNKHAMEIGKKFGPHIQHAVEQKIAKKETKR